MPQHDPEQHNTAAFRPHRSPISRRTILTAAALGGSALLWPDLATANPIQPASTLELVIASQPNAVILHEASAVTEIVAASADLANYIAASTGATIPRMTQAQLNAAGTQYDDAVRIYLGYFGAEGDPALPTVVAGLRADGFVIWTYGNTLTICGREPMATRFGVSRFLEDYVGVTWLMPTQVGDDVPSRTSVSVPSTTTVDEPQFISRVAAGVATGPDTAGKITWLQRNRNHERINSSHALYKVFPPSIYGVNDPEYYPMRNGARYIPPDDTVKTGWQPCFNLESGTAAVAVQYVLDEFAKVPSPPSVSLSVNDGGGFSDTDPVDDPIHLNSQNYVGRSNVYFTWINEVLAGVRASYVSQGKTFDKIVSVLAYRELADPPSFSIDPAVIPTLTHDRYGWVDSAFEQNDKQNLADWSAVAQQVAWYDYTYGTPYVVPRSYNLRMAQTYAYGAQHDVAAITTELYPNWGEGPKPWIQLKLMWNPALNASSLMDEWCHRAVGPLAAPYLRQYYDLWEHFWTQIVPTSPWFDKYRNGVYFGFNDASYLELLPSGIIAQCQSILGSINPASLTGPQAARFNVIKSAFQYYEESALSWPRPVPPPTSQTAALSMIETVQSNWTLATHRLSLVDGFQSNSLLYHPLNPRSIGLTWSGWNPAQFWGLVDYLKAHEPTGGGVTSELQTLADSTTASRFRDFCRLILQVSSSTATPLISNSSFEQLSGSSITHWTMDGPAGTLFRDTTVFHTGAASLRIHALTRGGPSQAITVTPGLMVGRAYVFAPGAASQWSGTIQFSVRLMNSSGTVVKVYNSTITPAASLAGQWSPVDFMDELPATISGVPISAARVVIVLSGFGTNPDLYLDDVNLYQLTA